MPMQLSARQVRVLKLAPSEGETIRTDLKVRRTSILNSYWQIRPGDSSIELEDQTSGKRVRLSWQVLDDLSDTWSHGIRRFEGTTSGNFRRRRLLVEERGPVRASLAWLGRFKQSEIRVRTRLYADDPFVELSIDLFWAHQKAVLKMIVEPGEDFVERCDGVPGGSQIRSLDGAEYPMHDWVVLTSADQTQLAVISGDVFALDADATSGRLTMVRSPRYALHMDDVPARQDPGQFPHDFLDQGEHEYRILIRLGSTLDGARLQRIAYQLQQPPIHWDMPYRKNFP